MDASASSRATTRWHAFQSGVASMPPYTLAAACGAWIAMTDGIAPHPYVDLWAKTARTFPRPPPGIYLQTSPIGPAIAHLIGATEVNAFVALHLAIVVAAVMTVVAVVRSRFGDVGARLAVAALFASPLSNVLLTWLGQPDPIVLGLGVVLAVVTSVPVLVASSIALGIAHSEQAVAIVVCLVAVRWAIGDLDRRRGAAMIAGVSVGVAAIAAFKAHYGIHSSRVGYAVDEGLGEFVDNFVRAWHSTIVASFGAAWIVVVLLARRVDGRKAVVFVVATLFGLSVAFLTLDTTRVFALVTFPVVVVLIGHAVKTERVETLEWILALTIAAGLLYPHLVVWDGTTYISSLSRTFDWFSR